MSRLLFIIAIAFLLSACTQAPTPSDAPLNLLDDTSPSPLPTPADNQNLDSSLLNLQNSTHSAMPENNTPTPTNLPTQATISTSMGDIVVKLFPQSAPVTVSNFYALATGAVDWINPQTGQQQQHTPLYPNTIFHRVIKDFMIQGGDPLGTGTGGPGYKFKDEFDSNLTFDKPYLLAMANSGPNTNGSQFFITTIATPWLTGKHTIFGEVVTGQAVVDAISQVATNSSDKPLADVTIKSITFP